MSIFTPDGDIRAGRTWSYGCLTAFLLFVVLPITLWAFGVFTSGVRGSANVKVDRNSAQNIEHWSATFNGEVNTINADIANLTALKAAESSPGATQQDRSDYTGALLVCGQDIAAYNQNLGNVLAVVPADDPQTPFPSTYCEGTAQ